MIPADVRIFVRTRPQDMRRSSDGLAQAARHAVGAYVDIDAWQLSGNGLRPVYADPAPRPACPCRNSMTGVGVYPMPVIAPLDQRHGLRVVGMV